MTDISFTIAAVTHTIHAIRDFVHPQRIAPLDRDRGAVSIEQVLWYAAAAVSVAVVATIIWSQIKSTAGTSVNTPSAP